MIVDGVNMMTRHKKPSQANPQGGLERIEAPLHVSKVAIEDPKTGKPTRVGFKVLEDGARSVWPRDRERDRWLMQQTSPGCRNCTWTRSAPR